MNDDYLTEVYEEAVEVARQTYYLDTFELIERANLRRLIVGEDEED